MQQQYHVVDAKSQLQTNMLIFISAGCTHGAKILRELPCCVCQRRSSCWMRQSGDAKTPCATDPQQNSMPRYFTWLQKVVE
jgi:hypothetical protein